MTLQLKPFSSSTDAARIRADARRHADEARLGFLAAALPQIPPPARLPETEGEVAAIVDASRARVAMAEAAGLRGVREEEAARLLDLADRCEAEAARRQHRPSFFGRLFRAFLAGFGIGAVEGALGLPNYPRCWRRD